MRQNLRLLNGLVARFASPSPHVPPRSAKWSSTSTSIRSRTTSGRTHYLDNDITPRRPFWQDHLVLGKVLQSAGYATAMFGKSHFSNNPHVDLGFDEYCIARFWPGYDGPPQAPAAKGKASMYAVQWYWHPGLVADGRGVPARPDDFGPDLEVDRIRNFISRRKSQLFFLYYRDVTSSTDPAVLAARNRFAAILQTIPAPDRNDPQIGPGLERFERRTKGARQTSGRTQTELPKATPSP